MITVIVVASSVVAATRAYFSDNETSTGNTLSMGTLDLKVNNADDPVVVHITRANLKPYPSWSHNYGGNFSLKNAGSVSGVFKMKIINIKNNENGCTEPETEAGDVSCGATEGELGGLTFVKWSRNEAPWGGWGLKMSPLNSAEGVVVTGETLAPGATVVTNLDLEWDTHAGTQDNLAQNDGVEFDILFSLDQI
ncbi:hypothetical protein HZC27_06240 [Candidatus Roizmanbacteria bacterium]|nr:hypothetical protein [Candidatus Roizmanbacteria bacterium]